jgi:hypothetical protein
MFEQHLLAAAVIEFRGPAIRMASDSLCGFESAVIFQKIRDAGRPAGLFESSFEHIRGVSERRLFSINRSWAIA